jgi:hypothetical protein
VISVKAGSPSDALDKHSFFAHGSARDMAEATTCAVRAASIPKALDDGRRPTTEEVEVAEGRLGKKSRHIDRGG